MLGYDDSLTPSSNTGLSQISKNMLATSSRWARFIAIVGLLSFAIAIYQFLSAASMMPRPGSGEWQMAMRFLGFIPVLALLIYLAIIVLQVYFYIQTLLFGNSADKVVKMSNEAEIGKTFTHQANAFKAMAITCGLLIFSLLFFTIYLYSKYGWLL